MAEQTGPELEAEEALSFGEMMQVIRADLTQYAELLVSGEAGVPIPAWVIGMVMEGLGAELRKDSHK